MIDLTKGTRTAAVGPVGMSLERLLSEQVRDWMRDDCRPFKFYLEREELVGSDPEAVIELINQEIVLRRRKGDAPRPEDYLKDYPDLAEPLSELFDIYDAISIPGEVRPRQVVPLTDEWAGVALGLHGSPQIPGYRIERLLGAGGMGIVYLADELALKRRVALKVLRNGNQDDSGQRSRLEREAAAVAKCQHPNLVQIFQIGEYQGELYLALEYVSGDTLAKALAGIPQPTREAAKLVEKLARAIDHAHSRGVVHRDLKPANVLLTKDGEPKITDFGLARLEENSTRTEVGSFVGTLAYMAPEQASGGQVEVGAPADIHALGVILYESLTGRPPYRADTPEKILQKLLFESAVPPSRLQPETPRDLEAICLRCLERIPSQRYATAAELAEDLRRFLDGRPTVARPLHPAVRVWRWCRRNRKLAAVSGSLAATVVVAVAALVGLTYRHNLQLRAEIARAQAKDAESRRNYREARSTIQAMLERLSDPRFTGTTRMKELGRDQMEEAVGFYDRILQQLVTHDPAVRFDMARALGLVSTVQHELGNGDEAEKHVRRALDMLDGLRSEFPENLEYLRVQVECFNRLGIYLLGLGGFAQAVAADERAVQLAEGLAGATPGEQSHLELVAVCHDTLAGCLRASNRLPEARDHYRKAIEIRDRLDPAKLPGLFQRHAETLTNDGVTLWNMNETAQALARFRQVEELTLAIPAEQRNNVSFGRLYLNWSGVLYGLRRFDDAVERASVGLDHVEPYLRTEPNDAGAREVALKLHGNRGLALGYKEKHRESADDWRRVVELAKEPIPHGYRVRLAIELVSAGDVAVR